MKVDGIWKFSGSKGEGELEDVEVAGMNQDKRRIDFHLNNNDI